MDKFYSIIKVMLTILDEIIQTITKKEAPVWQAFDKEKAIYEHKETKNKRTPQYLKLYESDTPLSVIAEIKQASPSQGIIVTHFNAQKLALDYAKAGVHAISVLTEKQYFKGSIEDLSIVRHEVSLPILRKDFIVNCCQVQQSYVHGADIILLIVAVLSDEKLIDIFRFITHFNMQILIEVHNLEELNRVLSLFSVQELQERQVLLGINNRDLHTFQVDIHTTKELAAHVPSTIPIISESGIFTKEDALFVKEAGAKAVLVGQGILQHNSLETIIKELTLSDETFH